MKTKILTKKLKGELKTTLQRRKRSVKKNAKTQNKKEGWLGGNLVDYKNETEEQPSKEHESKKAAYEDNNNQITNPEREQITNKKDQITNKKDQITNIDNESK